MLRNGWEKQSLELEPVSGFADGEEMVRIGRIILELASQLDDVCIHRACRYFAAMSPDLTQQIPAPNYTTAAVHQCNHQVVGFRREVDKLAVTVDATAGEVDFVGAETEVVQIARLQRTCFRAARTAQQRLDASQ